MVAVLGNGWVKVSRVWSSRGRIEANQNLKNKRRLESKTCSQEDHPPIAIAMRKGGWECREGYTDRGLSLLTRGLTGSCWLATALSIFSSGPKTTSLVIPCNVPRKQRKVPGTVSPIAGNRLTTGDTTPRATKSRRLERESSGRGTQLTWGHEERKFQHSMTQ